MRKTRFAACTLLLVFVAAGCRQTSGPTAGSPLTPIGPLAPVGLSPIGAPPASASSAMGSLSAPTRVPPPPSNSANTQAGAFVPYGQTSSLGPPPAVDSFHSPIGSGVATAGWTETNTNVPTSVPTNVPTNNATHYNQSVASGIRFNGMQVNDLTSSAPAPSPPYLAPLPPVQPAMSHGYSAPAAAVPIAPNPNFQAAQRFEQPAQSISPGPSTEPIGSAASADDANLPWRRPGTTY